jgi:pilus assembly protein Flp/PilA
MLQYLKAFIRNIKEEQEKGQTLIEYALLIVLIAVVVIAVLLLLGPQIATVFDNVRSQLSTF